MKLYILRHGETRYNVQRIRNDDPYKKIFLTSKGKEQAASAAQMLKNIPLDIIYCSQFPRTIQTANIINAYHSKKIVIDKRLGEHQSGFEGKLHSAWVAASNQRTDPLSFKLNRYESMNDVLARVQSFLHFLAEKKYQHVLIVTHGCVVSALMSLIKKNTFNPYGKVDHCSITTYKTTAERLASK